MRVNLNFIRETEKAVQYMDNSGREFWIPRSVIKHRTKYPAKDPLLPPVHDVDVEDWWWNKHEAETSHDTSPDLTQELNFNEETRDTGDSSE